MAKKPWRVVPQTGETGRFTRERIDEALDRVMARRAATAAKGDVSRSPRAALGRASYAPASLRKDAA